MGFIDYCQYCLMLKRTCKGCIRKEEQRERTPFICSFDNGHGVFPEFFGTPAIRGSVWINQKASLQRRSPDEYYKDTVIDTFTQPMTNCTPLHQFVTNLAKTAKGRNPIPFNYEKHTDPWYIVTEKEKQ